MNNEPPAHTVIRNFSDLKHKINNKWPNGIPLAKNSFFVPFLTHSKAHFSNKHPYYFTHDFITHVNFISVSVSIVKICAIILISSFL